MSSHFTITVIGVTNNFYLVGGPGSVDLDIDSDHTHDLGNGGPDRDLYEDEIEALCRPAIAEKDKFHKYVIVNEFHDTTAAPGYAEVIPGYADGFDFTNATTADDLYERPYQPQGLSGDNIFVPLAWDYEPCALDPPANVPMAKFGYRDRQNLSALKTNEPYAQWKRELVEKTMKEMSARTGDIRTVPVMLLDDDLADQSGDDVIVDGAGQKPIPEEFEHRLETGLASPADVRLRPGTTA